MLQLGDKLRGTAKVELLGAEPERLLERCRREGLRLEKIRSPEPCVLRLELRQEELPRLRRTAEGCGFTIKVMELRGGRESARRLGRRWVLLLGLFLAAALLGLSQLFVWQIRVQGCEELSQGQVLRALADCGVEPGSFGPGIRQEELRSRMLEKLPELEWMTVNVSGSRATVLVRERREIPELRRTEPAEIRAARSGIIQSVTVWEGRALVEPGDAVLEGELLVSGRLESLSRPAREVRAAAEIRAETWRELIAVCPLEMLQTRETGGGTRVFALGIGKKLLFPGKIPGKGLDECATIVHDYNLGAEGLFSLPLRLLSFRSLSLVPDGGELDRTGEMEEALLRRLQAETRGEILDYSFSVGRRDGLLVVTLQARCCEDIALTAEYES